MNGERVGTWRTAGGQDELRYAETWLQSPSARPISLKFPLRPGSTPYTGPYVHRYFDNLLPDAKPIRERIARRFRLDSIDAFPLLASIGRDCVGALQILPEDDAPPAKGCPKCGYKPFMRRCMRCAYEVEVAATVEHQPGEMREVQLTKGTKIDKQQLYQECVAYARLNSAPDKQRGRAGHLWKDITGSGDWPPTAWGNVPADVQVSAAVRTKILSLNIRNAKRRTRPGVEA